MPPELVLLDVNLPDVSGLDVCRRIKRDAARRGIKILLFSAFGEWVGAMLEGEDQADGYLSKPFTQENLRAAVSSLLD